MTSGQYCSICPQVLFVQNTHLISTEDILFNDIYLLSNSNLTANRVGKIMKLSVSITLRGVDCEANTKKK